jgi:glycerol kinase
MTNENGLALAIDQGGHATRAIVFDSTGTVVAKGACDVGERRIGDDRVEQDPEELLRSVRRAIKEAIKHVGRRETEIVRAGLATQRSSVIAWDTASGAALTPVLSWQDRRAKLRIDELAEHAGLVRAKTGLRLSPHYGASKLAWILAQVPAAAAALAEGHLALGPLASFLAFRLLDERPLVADPANASRTLLWSLATRAWDPALCDLFGVPMTALPRCVATRGEFGTLDIGKRKVPLTVITGDQSAAIFASGEPDASAAYVNFGTGAFVQRTFDDNAIDAPRLLKSVVCADRERAQYALEGTVNGAGSALHFAVEALEMSHLQPDLEGWMERETDVPIFVNGVSGLGAPYWVPDLEARFVGEGTREAQIVAVLESVVFLVAIIEREMERVLPRPATIRVSGGLTQLSGLCQRLANLTGIPVERTHDPESTARGLAWLVLGEPEFTPAKTDRFEPRADAALLARSRRFQTEIESAAKLASE